MRADIFRGLFWQGSTTVLTRGVRYVATLLLAGLLEPVHFGIFASLYVFIDGLYLVQGFGIGQALIVRRDDVEDAAHTSFWLATGLGVLFFLVAVVSAPAVEAFYRQTGLAIPFTVLAVVLVLHGLRVVPLRVLEKRLDFRAKVAPTVAGGLVYLVVAVAVALAGGGVWAFVIAVLAGSLVETAGLWIVSPWRPRLRFDRRIARELLAFGFPVMLGLVLIFLYNGADRLVIGRFAGAETLGPYAFALTLASLPVTIGSTVVNTVLLPSYASLAEREKQRTLFLRSTALVGGGALAFAAIVVAFGPYCLRAVYGTKWDDAVLPLIILAVASPLRSLASLTGETLVGIGRSDAYRRMNVVQLVVAIPCLWIGVVQAGTAGVAAAMGVASLAALVAGWSAVRGPLEFRLSDLGGALGPALLAAAVVLAIGRWVAGLLPLPEQVIPAALVVAAAAVAFLGGWSAIDPTLRGELARLRAGGTR